MNKTQLFIQKSTNIHGNKFDYSLVKYTDSKTKVKIICKEHGVFEQRPQKHLIGQKCPLCSGHFKKTNEDIIRDFKKIHGDKYDYSLVDYKNAFTKVKIICKEHGIFEQLPHNHLKNNNCPKCSITYKKDNNSFIEQANKIHNYKYDYSLVEYINNQNKIKIICKEHGIFKQSPNGHLQGSGCKKCATIKVSTSRSKSLENFIKESNEIHNYKYDYSLSDYKNITTKVIIICPKHGKFKQIPNSHLDGNGCPICKESKGEKSIRNILINNNIKFESQKKFEDCKYKTFLPFDFYLPKYNTCIEFDGIQHFKPIEYWGGEKFLKNIKKRDQIKSDYCKNNNIILIRIKYDENIKEKLNSFFNI